MNDIQPAMLRQQLASEFITLAMQVGALKFGTFKLKSGRESPYFFNAGEFHGGEVASKLGGLYARLIRDTGIQFDVMFGPAYKGIPLMCDATNALYRMYGLSVGRCFNRKEAKDHGEGGTLVGASLSGKQVLIIDDVITAGTAARESIQLIREEGGIPVGLVLSVDRQERGKDSDLSAVQECERMFGIPVQAIATLEQIMWFVREEADASRTVYAAHLENMRAYREKYGVV